MSGGGFFVTARKVFEQRFAGPYCEGFAWLWMISEAAWQDGEVLKRGQLEASQRSMAKQFGWTDDKVRWFLRRLQADQRVKIHTAPRTAGHTAPPTIITICNYDKYQTKKKLNPAGHTAGHTALEKEENKLTKDKKENIRRVEADHDQFFEDFWKAFPKRDGDNPKAKARAKFQQIAKSGTDPGVLIAAARQYASSKRNTERKFIPQAITWLNQSRWEDLPAREPLMSDQEREQLFAELRRKS